VGVDLNDILKIALKGGASDIHLKPGLPPMFRVDGALVPLKNGERIPPDELQKMAFGIFIFRFHCPSNLNIYKLYRKPP